MVPAQNAFWTVDDSGTVSFVLGFIYDAHFFVWLLLGVFKAFDWHWWRSMPEF
jgi:hypothetical protein